MLDEKDMEILKELRKNARVTMSELAKKLRISVPAVRKRILRLERNGVIIRYCARIRDELIGSRRYLLIIHSKKSRERDVERLLDECDCYKAQIGNRTIFYAIVSKEHLKRIEPLLRKVSIQCPKIPVEEVV